ncbi:MAG: hypothetical protein CMH70_02210 [Nitrosomonadaceae bacterium]|nr:hypothetical protein [Nitrosomonadaceae bacterium]|tara:strand:- start:1575 stop:1850 length:276 start_codon:yes stop_codon:yes gene_type:complete
MNKNKNSGNELAVKEHLLSGQPITGLEAMIFFGVRTLTAAITRLRKDGWIVKTRRLPFAAVIKRINDYAVLKPPNNLPIREIQLTEYWLSK